MALKCPQCSSTNPDNARFCWNCGEELVTTGFQPFRFRSGAVVNSLSELVSKIDSNWEDGKYHLYQGDLANWLGSIGRADIASEARNVVSSESDQDIGLEKFLQSLESDAPPSPQIQITPTSLDFGTVDGERVTSLNPTLQLRISNSGRGHLYGTVQSSDSWLTVDKEEFSRNSVTVTAIAKSDGKQAIIEVDSNGGKRTVHVKMNPVRPWYRIVVVKYAIAFIFIVLGGAGCPVISSLFLLSEGTTLWKFLPIIFLLIGWGPFIGLGLTILITRIEMRDEGWKDYLSLFIYLPMKNAVILCSGGMFFGITFFVLAGILGIALGDPNFVDNVVELVIPLGTGIVTGCLLMAVSLTTCFIFYHKAAKNMDTDIKKIGKSIDRNSPRNPKKIFFEIYEIFWDL